MVAKQRHFTNPGIGRVRRFGLVALLAVVSLAVAFGTLIPPPGTAHAVGNEPWLWLECLENEVEEGDDYRLQVRKKYHSDSPHETMRVFWYTDSITADGDRLRAHVCRAPGQQWPPVGNRQDGARLSYLGGRNSPNPTKPSSYASTTPSTTAATVSATSPSRTTTASESTTLR